MHRNSQFSQILRTVPTDDNQLALVVSHDAGTLSRLQGSFLLRNLGTEDQTVSFWKSVDPRRVDFTGSTPERATFTIAGPAATGTYTVPAGNLPNNATIVVNGDTYTLKTTLSTGPGVANEIKIGVDADDTAKNIAEAVMGPEYGFLRVIAQGSITTSGNVTVVVAEDALAGTPVTLNVAVVAGVAQVETATVTGTVTTFGTVAVTISGNELVGTPLTLNIPITSGVDAGTQQVETLPIVITGDSLGTGGYVVITITGDGLTGSPIAVPVLLTTADSAADAATAVAAALAGNATLSSFFASMVADGDDVVFTKDSAEADDATLNVSLSITGTAAGPANVANSTNTTAGDVGVTAQVETLVISAPVTVAGTVLVTVTSTLGGTVTLFVPLDIGTEEETATAIAAAIQNESDVTDYFAVSAVDDSVILTSLTLAADDAALNMALSVNSYFAIGIDAVTDSDDTVSGSAPGTAASDAEVALAIRTALAANSDVTAFATVSGSGANIVLTKTTKNGNDASFLITIANGTCVGLTTTTSANTTAGVTQDTPVLWAAKVRAALQANGAITTVFDIQGTGTTIQLHRKGAGPSTILKLTVADGTSDGVVSVGSGLTVTYGEGTTAQGDVTAAADGAVVTFTAATAGEDGDGITTTASAGTWSGATLTGGTIVVPPGVIKSVLVDELCSFFGISVISETASNPPNLQVTGTTNHGYTVNQDGVQARLRDPALEEYFSEADYTGYSVTGTPLAVPAGAVSITLIIPSGTSATVNDGTNNVVYAGPTAPSVTISSGNGMAFTNVFTISRSAGSGTIQVGIIR